ncbi:GspE/PulE family protein [Planctomycetota bacterium]
MARSNKYQPPQEATALVDELLEQAITTQASDIHFEPTVGGMLVKYRLDGQLQVVRQVPKGLSENLVARLKVLAGLLTYRNDIPQEGRIDLENQGSDTVVTEMRLAVFPTINGQRAVIRLFYQFDELQDISRLGMPESIQTLLLDFVGRSQGILLLTGPAGSGKSTTLAALMRHILTHTPGRSVVTVEDPVEIRIDGAAQVQITPHGEMTFPMALRSLLRQDPQILMLGEIRDAETARIAVEAGLTGHLLASTLHSGTPAGGLVRLLEMGIEPYQVTSSVTAVINQRLVRHLCPDCKKPAGASSCAPVGCDRCLGTGYKGRLLLAEALTLDTAVRHAVLARADVATLTDLQNKQGNMPLLETGRLLIGQGLTTEAELQRVCGSSTAP